MIAANARDRGEVLYRLLHSCGLPSVIAVAFGGLAAGTFVWSAVFRDIGAASPVAFVFMAVAGLLVAAALWLVPPAYEARAKKIDLVAVLRYDAIAYGTLAIALTVATVIRAPAPVTALTGVLAFGLAKIGLAARTSPAIRDAAFSFGITRAAVYVIGFLATAFFSHLQGHPSLRVALLPWASWDGLHYLAIAEHGYAGTEMVFFPLYPALIHLLAPATGGEPVLAALLVSNVAFFIALVFVHRIVARQSDDTVANRATLLLAAFPTSVFFSAAYTESLFLALTVAALFYLQEHRWIVAGILGGFAALTRVEGILLVAPYVVEIFTPESGLVAQIRASREIRRHLALGVGMIPLGLITYMLLLLLLCGDPLYFTHAQTHWSRTLDWPWVGVFRALRLIFTSGNPATIGVQTIELSFSVAAVAVLFAGFRWLPPAQRIYAILSLLLPLSTSSLMSMPRFALVVFPIFTILAVWAARERVYTFLLASFLPLLGFFVTLFTTGRWVA